MKLSVAALALGIPLLTIGVFLVRGGDISRVGYTLGLLLISFAVARLVWLGWRGRGWAWLVAAPPAAILTWTIYELVRQTPPYPPIGFLGTDTAPLLSAVSAIGLVTVGWLRSRAPDTRPR